MEVNSSVGELADNANKMLTFIQNEVMPDYDNLVNTGNQYNDDANRIDTLMLQFADSATALKDTMHEMATLRFQRRLMIVPIRYPVYQSL